VPADRTAELFVVSGAVGAAGARTYVICSLRAVYWLTKEAFLYIRQECFKNVVAACFNKTLLVMVKLLRAEAAAACTESKWWWIGGCLPCTAIWPLLAEGRLWSRL